MRPVRMNKKKLGKTIRKFVFCTSQAESMVRLQRRAAPVCSRKKKRNSVFARKFIFISIHFFIIA